MKKLLSIVLAMAMVLALGVTAFAAESVWNGESYTGGNEAVVNANYAAGTSTVKNVCKVNISWEVTNGSYTAGSTEYTWNADDHKYIAGEATGTSTTNPSVKVTLTNHSDITLYADIAYTDTNDTVESNATAINDVVLVTGVTVNGTDYANATYVQPDAVERTLEITISDWTEITQTDEEIGKVTVTLSKTSG